MKRYENIDTEVRWDGKKIYKTTQYPVIIPQDTDLVVISSEGDFLDNLAFKYYNDPSLYWIIALSNNIGKGRMSVPTGIQLRIPMNITDIVSQFNSLNT